MKRSYLLFVMFFGMGAIAQPTIYSGDGTLSSNRTVTMNARNLTFTPTASNSQFFINGTTGNCGFGTLAPSSRVEVNGKLTATSAALTNSVANGATFANSTARFQACAVINMGTTLPGSTSGARLLNFYDFPSSNLDANTQVNFNIHDRGGKMRYLYYANKDGGSYLYLHGKTQENWLKLADDGSNTAVIEMPKAESYIGIGTTAWNSEGYKLSVNGGIRANRVKVYTSWADYVFEENYQLPTLEDVEQHIAEKGHLKDIPSACEVEENGIELGEMNRLLLQKVEELTLYILDLNRQLTELRDGCK